MADQPSPGEGAPSSGGKAPGGAPTPHDAVFRRVFGVPVNAASELRAVLSAALLSRLDLGQLAPAPGSFVDESLRWRHSDLLFTAPLDGRDAFIYVLIEHQSSDDPLMAYRMLRYMTRIWDQYEREHPQTRRLPAVIPLVVHHGKRRWASPAQLLDVIDLDLAAKEAALAYLPRFEFLLDDLSGIDDRQLRDRDLTPSAEITLVLLRDAPGNRQIVARLRPRSGKLRAVLDQPDGGEVYIGFMTYIELVSETPVSELHDLAVSLGPDAEEAYVTTAETLRAEGRVEGRAEGRVEAIFVVFEQRGIDVDDKTRELIESCTDLDTLNGWFRRAFKVDTASELFEG
jgi:hypothetical protein